MNSIRGKTFHVVFNFVWLTSGDRENEAKQTFSEICIYRNETRGENSRNFELQFVRQSRKMKLCMIIKFSIILFVGMFLFGKFRENFWEKLVWIFCVDSRKVGFLFDANGMARQIRPNRRWLVELPKGRWRRRHQWWRRRHCGRRHSHGILKLNYAISTLHANVPLKPNVPTNLFRSCCSLFLLSWVVREMELAKSAKNKESRWKSGFNFKLKQFELEPHAASSPQIRNSNTFFLYCFNIQLEEKAV